MPDSTPDDNIELTVLEKLHSETALIAWKELQKFFAQGVVIAVDISLDLVQTAVLFADDQADEIAPLLESGDLAYPKDSQARKWYESDTHLWSVVVAPYVLVQEQKSNQNTLH